MKTTTFVMASLVALGALSVPASAYTACNRDGDCWHTDARTHFKGATLSFHDDKWWDKNKENSRYHWHESDNDHDSHHGYWAHGEWHAS